MNQLKKLLFMFAAVCLLLILVPSISYANTTTNLVYDSTGSNPNGYYKSSEVVTINNWYMNPMNLNKAWNSCVSVKIGLKFDALANNPQLGNYTISVFNGYKWIQSKETVNIAKAGIEYIFEPVFESTDIKAIAIHPNNYNTSDKHWREVSYVTVYSITQGFARQAAVIDDFDFNPSGKASKYYTDSHYIEYNYQYAVHFTDLSILEINNKYYLKGMYYVRGNSGKIEIDKGSIFPISNYQSSRTNISINGNSIENFSMSGDPGNNYSGLYRDWNYPEGIEFFIALGSTKPSAIICEAVHSGSCGDLVIDQKTTNKNINFNINTSPTITVSNPTPNKIYSEADTSLAPAISVSDTDNQSLTCKYFIDNETVPRDAKTVTDSATQQTVSFAGFNAGALSDGIHTIRFEVYDGKDTTKVSRSIKVDRSAPIINKLVIDATANSITVRGSAADTICSPDSLVYNVNISSSANGSTNSVYTSSNVYTQNGLVPGTKYYISFKVRDAYGHIGSYQGVAYTKK